MPQISQARLCSLELCSFVLQCICESALKPLGISTTCPKKGKEENNPKRQVLVAAQTLLP